MLPTVTGAYISTRPPASRTMMAPLPFVSSIDVPCGVPSALLLRWPCCVGSRSGSTAGTMMVLSALIWTFGLSLVRSAGLT